VICQEPLAPPANEFYTVTPPMKRSCGLYSSVGAICPEPT